MNTIKFKTNLKCSGCVEKIAKVLDNNPSIKSWEVDLSSTEKELKVETSLSEKQVQELIASVGFKTEVK